MFCLNLIFGIFPFFPLIFFLLDRFTISFQTGESDGDDIAFRINPQLGNCVALNCFRNGIWETEESVSDKAFIKGAAFNMFVVIKSEGYEVCILNKYLNNYICRSLGKPTEYRCQI